MAVVVDIHASRDPWRDLLISRATKTGTIIVPNVSNVVTILQCHEEWTGCLAWDASGERIVTRRTPPWHEGVSYPDAKPGPIRETDTVRIIDWLVRSEGLTVGPKIVEQAVPVVAEAAAFHPVREYLEGLAWDGVERLPTWLSTYAGAEQNEYSAAVGARWLISAVARPMEPGCQVDCMLVLEGPQGIRKSTLFRSLVPDMALYSETGVTIGDKDSYQVLHGVWIYLLDELDSLKRGDVTKTKNFLTSPKDHYRPSYGRIARDFYRQCVFAGTTNEETYLVDRTGNRRFWPVRVVRPIDIAGVVRDRDQLWAEAFQRYCDGEHWYVDTPELRKLCEAQQAERVAEDPWEHFVGRWLSNPRQRKPGDTDRATGEPFDISQGVLTSDVLVHAIGKASERVSKADEMRIAQALKELGYERGPRHRENGTRVRRYIRKAGTAGTEARDTPNEEKTASESHASPPSLPNTRAHTGDERSHEKTQTSDPGVSSGDSDRELFADWLDEQGIEVGE